ncbi:MAG: hypothetical protein FWD69_12525 [Polyangiaceae bacterium]|nr:hypothetical protein [Polyangiaceae bacterium]
MTMKKEVDAATGKAAFERVKSSLMSLSPERLMQPNIDLQSAAMAALVLVDRANIPDRRALFSLLPESLFMKNTIEDLETMANAMMHVELESFRERAVSTDAKVDVAVVQQATEVRARMLKTADYNIGHLEMVAREIADIRLGAGYLDLANDCTRLAVLYASHRSELALDKRLYRASDAELAASLANKIRAEYRASATRSGPYAELRPRAFTELTRLYNDVRAAAQFIFRAEPAVLNEFPPLRSAVVMFGPARTSKKAAEAPATDGASQTPIVAASEEPPIPA